MNQHTPTPNHITVQDLMDVAKDLGNQSGKSADAQIKFLLKVVEGGYHNAVDLVRNKHGQDIDDATKLGEAYVNTRQAGVVFDAKAPNQQKLISYVRKTIEIGQWPKGGVGEPLQTINNLMTMRQKLRQIPAEVKKLDDAANTLLKYARAQLKRDTLIDDAELRTFCFKSKKKDAKTSEERVVEYRKMLDKLIKGDLPDGAQDSSSDVIAARDALTSRLIDIAKAKGAAKQGGTNNP